MEKGFFTTKVIEPYFLDRETPYTKRRPLKMKTVYWTGSIAGLLLILSILFFGSEAEQKLEATKLEYSATSNNVSMNNAAVAGSINASPTNTNTSNYNSAYGSPGYTRGGGYPAPRTRSANQVIRRGEGGSDPASRLPMGYGIPVRLLNAVLSSDSSTPVIAEITQDIFPPSGNEIAIPVSTRAIGNASYDSTSQRIQIHFHTLVYPGGDQHGVQGMGLMADGSAGLPGEYHSGETKRQVGKFIGNFIGGLAEGMKEKTTGGQAGIPFEPGSIKNGLLNGVSQSASDQSRSFSEDLGQTKATMTLSAGESFIIFLEHEYTP